MSAQSARRAKKIAKKRSPAGARKGEASLGKRSGSRVGATASTPQGRRTSPAGKPKATTGSARGNASTPATPDTPPERVEGRRRGTTRSRAGVAQHRPADTRLADALEQQHATAEILRVISSSRGDVQPAFTAIVENAARLCQAEFSAVAELRDDGLLHLAAISNMSPEETAAYHSLFPRPPRRDYVMGRAFADRRPVHVEDVRTDPEYDPRTLAVLQRAARYRSYLGIPILLQGVPIGVVGCGRRERRPFTEAQVALAQTFAEQAAVAVENARLFTEVERRNRDLAETLEQQTATSEILRVISRSPTDAQPVFDSIARSATQLCQGDFSQVFQYDGTLLHFVAEHGHTAEAREASRDAFSRPPDRGSAAGRAVLSGTVELIPDIDLDPEYTFGPVARIVRFRSIVAVPIMRDGRAVGVVAVGRLRPGPFSDRHLDLLRTFADQAVIAIENVRLFTTIEGKNRDLSETLEQQTATGEILRVISSSPTDVAPVFATMVQNASRLCEATYGGVFLTSGDQIVLAAVEGFDAGGIAAIERAYPRPIARDTTTGRSVLDRRIVHIPDTHADPDYTHPLRDTIGLRSVLTVPIYRDGAPIGAISVWRGEVRPFTSAQIALLQTFADQAVIALENVRLFIELRTRNGELTETLEQQTATGDILRVISSSPTDVRPVFDTIVANASVLCAADSAAVYTFDGVLTHLEALANPDAEQAEALRRAYPMRANRGHVTGRAILTGRPVHIADVRDDPEYALSDLRDSVGLRSLLSVPMIRDGAPIGAITVQRWGEPRPFSDKQAELLKTFADQAVIAIQNVRLFRELEVRNRDLTESLERQTATSEILRVISSSPTDARPVFDMIAHNARALCGADSAAVFTYDGALIHLESLDNVAFEGADALRQAFPAPAHHGNVPGRAILQGRPVHIDDIQADASYDLAGVVGAGLRSVVAVPMVRDGAAIGVIVLHAWSAPRPFTESQIALLQTFSDQAVIAIQNVRLFTELDARTRDLTRSVGELRALGEVSRAVGSSLDLETVLETIVSRAVELSGSASGVVYEFDEASQSFQARATHEITPEYLTVIQAAPIRLGEGSVGRAGVTREPVAVVDIEAEAHLVAPQVRGLLAGQGLRSLLAVPLVREDRLLGGLVIIRREPGAFSPDVVAMLGTFATQSALAIHNARLFREIEREKQYSEALVSTSPVAIVTIDLTETVAGWNPGAERLFGYAAAEALGRRMEDLIATPELRGEVRANVQHTIEGEWIRAIGRRARKDGTFVDVEISSMPVVVGGARRGMIGIYHDITELLRARRDAEAANEAKSAFLATMSHEIRTPMNAVIGMSGLLLGTALTDEQREYAEIVRQSGDALLTVINDILDFSKIEAGRLELEAHPFDLRECAEGALDLVAVRAAEKGLDLAYVIGDGVPAALVGDVTRLRQILLNLLSNAVKFTERGEVVLTISARPGGPELTFALRDTGIGIPADRLDRLFQSFSQIDASTTRRYGGTGLGLAISQRLAELMGGRIDVSSTVGVGSEFRLTLALPQAAGPVVARRDLAGVQPSLAGKRVLVVDDNATNRRILTAHLEAWGMTARASGSPIEALGWVAGGERFDIGILDMHMPEMDGIALAGGIRREVAGAALPLVLFTSLGRREARAEEAGFASYLSKPIKPSLLFDALATILADQPVHVVARPGPAPVELDPEMAARHPLRILLAEDNVVNQKLALRLLAQMGYRADLAANGLEAVAAVERQTYDVVLMDVQMPEMDGFEASREVNRRWPGAARPRIVAMTANALEGDRELCVAAGMDDYVAKPVRVEELVAALARSGRRASAPATRGGASGSAPRTDALPVLDAGAVQRLAATMGGEFAVELIDAFGQDSREQVSAMRRALAAGDLDALRRAAHSLKSTSETLGAGALAAVARQLEASAREGRTDGAGGSIEAIAADVEDAARALEEVRRGLSA